MLSYENLGIYVFKWQQEGLQTLNRTSFSCWWKNFSCYMKNHALCCLVLVSLGIWYYSNGYTHDESANAALSRVHIYMKLRIIEFIVFIKLIWSSKKKQQLFQLLFFPLNQTLIHQWCRRFRIFIQAFVVFLTDYHRI